MVVPGNLRTEYLVNPLGLDVAQPRLTWVLTAPPGAPRNLAQASYRILVASSPEILAQDKGDLWDSGMVKSAETANIPYGGSALASRQACSWKVQVTDSLGQTSAWSQPASWEMGLLAAIRLAGEMDQGPAHRVADSGWTAHAGHPLRALPIDDQRRRQGRDRSRSRSGEG